jgi:hypothetical protein
MDSRPAALLVIAAIVTITPGAGGGSRSRGGEA